MATIREVVVPREKKKDGTWNVKIRVIHNGDTTYIKTQHFVNEKQVRKDYSIKDPVVLKMVNPVLDEYRTKITELGPKVELYSLKQLVNVLTNRGIKTADEINVIEFGRGRIEELKAANRNASAANMTTVVNSLIDFFNSEVVPVTEIRTKMLQKYEQYLRSERKMSRDDQFKIAYKRTVAGLSDTGLHNHMRDLRILFNNIREFYNDEDLGVLIVKHYPFKKYKIVQPTEKLKPKLTIPQVIAIRDCKTTPGGRKELARDLFMLSFYLCGMNAVDLYQLPFDQNVVERIGYNRSKTKGRRKDRAYISINIPAIAVSIYEKYAGKLALRYSTHIALDRALSIGMRAIGKEIKLADPEFYDARHAFGDWARNVCRFSKDDVGLALNHKDQTNAVTDFYVSKNWAIIDEVQAAVIKLLDQAAKKKSVKRLRNRLATSA